MSQRGGGPLFDIVPWQQPEDGLTSDAQMEIQGQLFHHGLDMDWIWACISTRPPINIASGFNKERLHRARMTLRRMYSTSYLDDREPTLQTGPCVFQAVTWSWSTGRLKTHLIRKNGLFRLLSGRGISSPPRCLPITAWSGPDSWWKYYNTIPFIWGRALQVTWN